MGDRGKGKQAEALCPKESISGAKGSGLPLLKDKRVCPCHGQERGEEGGGHAQRARPGLGHGESLSVPEGVDVIVQADGGSGGGALVAACLFAAAPLDPHHVAEEALSVGAVEAQAHRASEGGGAAAAVRAAATRPRAVPASGGASGKSDPDRILGTHRSLALLPSLARGHQLQVTLSYLTKSGLSNQAALGVLVGHPAGNAHATAGGAFCPACGLSKALGSQLHLVPREGHHLSEGDSCTGPVVCLGLWQRPRLGLGLQLGPDVVGMGLGVGHGLLLRILTNVVVVIAQPLLTAASRRAGQSGPGAAPVRQGHLMWAEGHAAHHPVHAAALVLTAGLEVLTVLVNTATELAGATLGFCSTQSPLRVSTSP